MTRFEKPADFVSAVPARAARAPTIKTLALLAALLAYAAGFVILLSYCRKQRGGERLGRQRPGAAAVRRPLTARRAAARAAIASCFWD